MKLKTALLLLFLGVSGVALHAETVAATVDRVSGNVYATTPSGKSKRVQMGDHIMAGSLVHTNADSSIGLKLVPGASTVLGPGTDVVLSTLEYSKSAAGIKTRKVKLTLKEGKLVCSLAKHDGHSDFRVVTPGGVTLARGTVWEISFTPSAGVSVETVNGVVEIILPGGKTIQVPGGQFVTSPNGVTTVTGTLTHGQLEEITNALGAPGTGGGGGGGTFSVTPVNSTQGSNPSNTSNNTTVSPNE